MICLMNVSVTHISILQYARICLKTKIFCVLIIKIEVQSIVFYTILPLYSQKDLGAVLLNEEQRSMIQFSQYLVMVDQRVEITVTNANALTHRYFATTLATPTFLRAIVIVMELKTQLGNTSTCLTVLEDLMKCFVRNVSNAMPLAKFALTFCRFVTNKQTAMIPPMKVTAPMQQNFLEFFHPTPK